jgi:protein gp37
VAEKTGIAWCDSTFNPWLGCAKIGPACDHCYAERFGKRMGIEWGPNAQRRRTSASTWKQPLRWNRKAEIAHNAWEKFKTSYIGLTDADLEEKGFVKPRRPRVFCGSLCDVFDNAVPEQWRADLFELIRQCQHLDFLLLTKRIGNAREMILRAKAAGSGIPWPPEPNPNVWLGITVCNQEEADRDIPKLLATPAAKRFLSIEPMLGPVDIERFLLSSHDKMAHNDQHIGNPSRHDKLDWIICGGETGPHARPLHPDWVRSLRDQCKAAGTAFFFKQWGNWCQADQLDQDTLSNGKCDWVRPDGGFASSKDGTFVNGSALMYCVGKKAAGRMLDGRTWEEFPK